MFNRRKKKVLGGDDQNAQKTPHASSKLKHSLLSLEQRLMFDAAAAATASEVASEQVAQEQAEAAVSGEADASGQTSEQSDSQGLLQAIATYNPGESTTEIAFVDPTVPDYQEMIAGMGPNVEVVVLDATRDGVEQIAESLAGRSGIDAIHLISHGSSGELQLGTGTLNAESMSSEYADEFATIRGTLSDQADILVYGCNFGEGEEGGDAVNLLAELTGADVAASNDQTGHIDLGGDWEFEVQAGSIETNLALTDTAQMNWAGILGTETVRDTFSSTSYSNNNGTQSWSTSWSETDASKGGAGDGDVRINSGQLRIDTDTVGNAISRGVDLSHASSAKLTFDYTNKLTGGDRIEARASSDGGKTYLTLSGGVFSTKSNTGSGSASFDLSDSLSANTRIQFIVTGTGGGDRLYVDNVQVSYNTGAANSAPTINSNGGGATASINVAENASTVTTVAATDADAGQTLSYSIAGGADAAKFTINSSTGALSFVSTPNYESPTDSGGNNVYDVTVQVSDGVGGTDTQAIAVTVTNTNETPTDLALSSNTVAENAANGTVVGSVTGTDPDSGDTKSYGFTDNAGGRFAINSGTGVITVANSSMLNYESATSHSVTVRVTDAGGLSYDETFTINLTNVNEAPILGTNEGATVDEGGSIVLTAKNLEVVDVDNSSSDLRYTLTSLPASGALLLKGTPLGLKDSFTQEDINNGIVEYVHDGSETTSDSLSFVVEDSAGGAVEESTFKIGVIPVNDAPTDLTLSANSVAENASTGTVVGTVSGTDPDGGDTKTYSLTDTAGGRFAINASTGVITVADGSLINYEAATSHDVSVRVTDSGGLTYDETFTINLTNINEAPTGADATVTINEDTSHTLTTANFGFSDVDAGDSLSAVRIDSLPTAGTMTLSGVTVTPGQVIAVADIMAGNLVFTPAANATGSGYASLTFSVRDGSSAYDIAPNTLTVDVTAVNDAPTDLALSANTVAENAANGTVVGTVTGTDPDSGDTKTYSFTDTAGGRFAINSSTGQITVADSSLLNYESATSHSVTVQVTDAGGLTYDETFTINLTNVNEAPTGADATVTLTEDTTQALTPANFGFTDVDAGDSLSAVRIDTLPGAGTLTLSGAAVTAGQVIAVADIAAGNLLFTPAADATGTGYANLTFSVRDSNSTYDAAPNTLTIDVTAVNDAPVNAVPGAQSVAEDTPLALSGISVTDVDGNLSTVQLGVLNGTLNVTLSGGATISAGNNGTNTLTLSGSQVDINATLATLVYQGNLNYNGADTLTVTSTDTNSGTDVDTVALTVTAVNDAPVITVVGPNVTFVEGGSPQVIGPLMTMADVDSTNLDTGVLTISLTQNGTADDRLLVGNFGTGPGQVSTSGSNVSYEGVVIGTFTGGTSDSDPLVITFNANATVAAVQEVVASIQFQNVSESPSTATRQVTFELTDGDGGTATPATKLVNVQATNDAPTDLALSANTVAENAANGTVVGSVTGTDADTSDTKTYTLTDAAGGRFAINSSTGQITVADGSLLNYESATNHTVTVRVTDNGGLTYDETFTINLTNVNEAPTGADATVTINEDTAHTLSTANFGFSDVDAGDSLSAVRIDTLPGAGTVTLSGVAVTAGQVITAVDITAGNLVFTPVANATGTGYANLTFSVRDSGNVYDAAPNTLTLDVTAVNDAPVNAVPGAQSVAEDTPLALSGISVNDVDGNLSTVQLGVLNGTVSVTLQGGASISAGNNGTNTLTLSGSQVDINATLATLVYQGNLNYNGADTLTVTSTDTNSGTDVDTVALTVTAVNDATVMTGGTSGSSNEDTTVTGTLTATDAEGLSDGTVFSVTGAATQGTASIDPATGLWSYQPTADWNGTDSFTVTITDDAGNTTTQVISVTMTPVVDLTNDSLTTTEDTAISANVLTGTNGATVDSFEGTPVLTGVTQGANGSVTFLADGTVTYTPNANFSGTDSFTYTITSGGVTETATVTVNVTAVSDPTVVTGGTSGSGTEDTTLSGTLTATDAEGLSDGTVFTVSANATNGTASIDPATGLWSYQPTADWNGTDSFTVTITDDAGNTTTQVITVTVTAVNDAPVLTANTGSTVAEGDTDTIVASELAVTDVDTTDAQLTYTIGTGPIHGQLELISAPGVPTTTFTQADIAGNRVVYVHDGSETTSDSFTFTMSDGAGGSLTATTVTLTITPVNDAPTITSNGGGSAASINVAENVSAVTIVTSADVDLPSQVLTYSLNGGADQALFTIDASTGALNFAAPPDFEVATDANGDHVYVVQVQVIDSQGASTTQMIQVTVTDVAETVVAPSNVLTIPPVLLSLRESEKRSQPVVIERNELPASLSTTTTEQPSTPAETAVHRSGEMMPSATPIESPIFIKQEDIRRYDTAKLEPVMPRWDDSSAASPFTIMPVEPEQSIDSKLPEDQPSISDVLLAKLDAMAKSLEEEVGVEQEHEMMVARVAALGGTTLSVGFVAWAVRSSAILASCLTTLPVWKSFDPLAVTKLSRQERDRRRQATDAAQRQEQDEFGGLEKFF